MEKIKDETFSLPKHKDVKGLKKENKKGGRFKFYKLTN